MGCESGVCWRDKRKLSLNIDVLKNYKVLLVYKKGSGGNIVNNDS